jgi:hypothetical protein
MGRKRFFFNLGALGAAVLLIVAAGALSPSAAKGVGLGIGSACCAFSLWFVAALVHRRRLDGYLEFRVRRRRIGVWSAIGWAIAGIAVWEIVQAAVFEADVSRWLTLADGLMIAALGCAGLITHEVSTERVVYVLEVVERPDRDN